MKLNGTKRNETLKVQVTITTGQDEVEKKKKRKPLPVMIVIFLHTVLRNRDEGSILFLGGVVG